MVATGRVGLEGFDYFLILKLKSQSYQHHTVVTGIYLVWFGCILHMLNELGVEEGEARELVLVEVHHEQLVGGCELCALTGELAVKV